LLHSAVLPVQHSSGLPAWMFMAGPHGEYELLFTVPELLNKNFELACQDENWKPLFLGEVIAEKGLSFFSGSLEVHCHPATIANLFYEANGNIHTYFELLMQQHKTWIKP
jgi:hypothetical protein